MEEPRLLRPQLAVRRLEAITYRRKDNEHIQCFVSQLQQKITAGNEFGTRFIDSLWNRKVISVPSQRQALSSFLQQRLLGNFAYALFELVNANIGNTSTALRQFVILLLNNDFRQVADILEPEYVEYFAYSLRQQPSQQVVPKPKRDVVFSKQHSVENLDQTHPLPQRLCPLLLLQDIEQYLFPSIIIVENQITEKRAYNTKWQYNESTKSVLNGGLCLIFDIQRDSQSEHNSDTSVNMEPVKTLFKRRFGMLVIEYPDVTINQYQEAFEDIKQMNDVGNYSYLIVCIMCHGDEDNLYLRATPSNNVRTPSHNYLHIATQVRDLIGSFEPFVRKPKLVFIESYYHNIAQGMHENMVSQKRAAGIAGNSNANMDVYEESASVLGGSRCRAEFQLKDLDVNRALSDETDGMTGLAARNAHMAILIHRTYRPVLLYALVGVLQQRAHYKHLGQIAMDLQAVVDSHNKTAVSQTTDLAAYFWSMDRDFYFYCPQNLEQ